MIPNPKHYPLLLLVPALLVTAGAHAQTADTPMSRMRSIGEPSAVDQFRPANETVAIRETAYQQTGTQVIGSGVQSPVQQTAMLQQFDAPTLPPSGSPMQLPGSFTPPPTNIVPSTAPPPTPVPTPVPQANAPRGLPVNPNTATMTPVPLTSSAPIAGGGDLTPLAAPQLNDGFATIGNCNCVSAPSNYVAATGGECAPVSYQANPAYVAPQTYVAPPAEIAAPVVVPAVPTGKAAGVPKGPLVSFGQDRNPVQVGQGLFGQPVAYVPGQRFRNWIRYVFP